VENLKAPLPLLPDETHVLIVTHDVDWPLKGPGTSHILDRRARFDPEVIRKVEEEGFNPYFGVPTLMEIEEHFGIRSTFFFRPRYDDESTADEYRDTIKSLVKGGWEVGLHANSTSSIEEVVREKEIIDKVVGKSIVGSRVHFLKISPNTFLNLAAAKIKYDSSVTFDKEKIDPRNSGFMLKSGVIVFPITYMDAYLFSYMGLNEKTVNKFILKTMKELFASGIQLLTLLWHDNSIMMEGGRAYSDLIKKLASNSDITILKGIEAYEMVQKQGIH